MQCAPLGPRDHHRLRHPCDSSLESEARVADNQVGNVPEASSEMASVGLVRDTDEYGHKDDDDFADFRSPTSAWSHNTSPLHDRLQKGRSISPGTNSPARPESPLSPAKRQFTGRIVGQGSLGLSVNIKHEGRTGKIKGIQLGNISGAALVNEPLSLSLPAPIVTVERAL